MNLRQKRKHFKYSYRYFIAYFALNDENFPFPEILRKKREEAGLSQLDLSEKIGYHVNTINFWERGQFNPSNFALIDVCDFFDIPYDILKKTR